MTRRPIIGVTMGDPAGIGPEIVIKAWRNVDLRAKARIIALGSADRMQKSFRQSGMTGRVHPISAVSEAIFHEDALDVLDVVDADLDSLTYGQVQSQAGQAAYEAVIAGIDLALAQEIDAIATAPLNKAALNQAGHAYSGHTELLAERTNTFRVTMMLVAGHCRVSHVSTHCSLAEAVQRVKRERILEVIRLTHESLTQMGISAPLIAVAGLNPHAGEGGLFGREEIEQIAPALEEAAAQGFRVTARPLPPDTVFYRMYRRETYDAVVAMYHDQGHIPIKMVGFSEGVNVTLGLPIIRTSVDHGTAFDIAGQGLADPTSMVRAIELAVTMAHGKGKA